MAGSKSRISASTDAATDGVTRVEIVTRGEARREYTPDERARILTEAAMPGARMLLGSVTGLSDAQVDHGGGEMGEAHPTAACFVASQGNAGKILEPGEQVLDVVPPGIQHGIPRRWIDHAPLG
jgi:hypothetical protein